MYFQTSPILPQLSGLGFAFDHTPFVQNQARHGAFPFLVSGMDQHSGVRRRGAEFGRMGGQRRTSWLAGLGATNPSTGEWLGPGEPPRAVSEEQAAAVAAAAAQVGFITGAAVAAVPAAVVGLIVGYFVWGGK